MRTILTLTILLLGVSSGSPEPQSSSPLSGTHHAGRQDRLASLVEIETSTGKGDRQPIAEPAAAEDGDDTPTASAEPYEAAPITNALFTPDSNALFTPDSALPVDAGNAAPQVSLDQLCSTLVSAAEDNNLPVAFFANLIWQESRLRDDAVSPKGALGIAQFMPKVAQQSGLDNPFDPMQALPASARMLHGLRQEFGNLGFVAAAYNAGAKRVAQWLERRRTLPRETRGYVLNVTGRSVEEWRKTPPSEAALRFARRLPCRDLPTFTELEQARLQQLAEIEQAAQKEAAEKPKAEPTAVHEQVADAKRVHVVPAPRATAQRDRHGGRREAKARVHHGAHEHQRRV